ncbi:hypothetical protein PsYK624_159740 [Phanerochaete sordida]|uniref:Uncharacterized protein n=1 Tax=Phanerochaete sordida TaxID=48140 RepID=A0A9P3LLH1_9APHY|nr:hypothetical protein PsYK624_159740 [Phanerochaete sordida]
MTTCSKKTQKLDTGRIELPTSRKQLQKHTSSLYTTNFANPTQFITLTFTVCTAIRRVVTIRKLSLQLFSRCS